MAYTWGPTAEWGGGFQMIVVPHPVTTGTAAAGGDLWGDCYITTNYGSLWKGSMLGINIQSNSASIYARAGAWSKKNPGTYYLGTGGLKSGLGSGNLVRVTYPNYVDTTGAIGFGTNFQTGAAGSRPRGGAGDLIQVDYDGTTEYAYCLCSTGSNFIVARSSTTTNTIGNSFTTLWTSPIGTSSAWKSSVLFTSSGGTFPDTLLVGSYRNPSTDGSTQTGSSVWKISAGSSSIRAATGSSDLTISSALAGAPGVVEDMKLIGGTIYAACGPYGLYAITGDGATWTKVSGSFFSNSWCSAVSGIGNVLYVGCAGAGGKPTGANIVAKSAISGISGSTFSWVTSATVTHGTTGKTNSVPWGTSTEWFLLQTGAPPFNNYLGGSTMDIQMAAVDPTDSSGNTVYVCGNAGTWLSKDGGASWRPAVIGLQAENMLGSAISGASSATSANSDYGTQTTTDKWQTVKWTSKSQPGGMSKSLSNKTDGSGNTYSLTLTSGSPDVKRQGVSIADDYFRGSIHNPCDFKVFSDGTVYIQQYGGSMIGRPGGVVVTPPGTPGTPSLSVQSSSSIKLTWTASTPGTYPVASYTVSRSADSGATYSPVASPAASTYTDTGLTQGARYDYKLQAVDTQGNLSAVSTAAHATTTSATPPGTPGTPSLTVISDTEIDLTWTAATVGDNPIAHYVVNRNGVDLPPLGNVTSFNDTGRISGTSYTYTVRAVDNTGLSGPASSSATASTTSTGPGQPGQPTLTVVSSNEIDLTWTAAAVGSHSISHYIVTRNGVDLPPLGNVLGFNDTGLAAATQYTYQVRAVDSVGTAGQESVSSTATTPPITSNNPPTITPTTPTDGSSVSGASVAVQVSAAPTDASATRVTRVQMNVNGAGWVDLAGPTGGADTQPPSVPTGLTLTPVIDASNNSVIEVLWKQSTDNVAVAGYHAYRDGSFLLTETFTSFSDVTVTPGQTYAYRVSAFDAAGNESAQCTAKSATALTPTPPSGDPVIVGTATGTGTTSASVVPNSQTQSGDTMTAFVSAVGATTITPPSGWTAGAPVKADGTRVALRSYTATAAADESNPYTWTVPGATSTDVTIVTVRGGALGATTMTGSSGSSTTTTTLPATSGRTTSDLIVGFVVSDSGPTFHASKGATIGVMPNGSASNWSDNTALATFETLIGRDVHYAHHMVPWDVGSSSLWPPRALGSGNANVVGDYNHNRVSYISWPRPRTTAAGESSYNSAVGTLDPCTVFDNFVAGTYDTVLTHLANGLAAWEHPVVIRLLWEMNQGMPWSVTQTATPNVHPAKYIAAWKHIFTLIRGIAPNARFHWNPGFLDSTSQTQESYWPGVQFVHYAGSEGYFNVATGTQTASKSDTWPQKMSKVYADWSSQRNVDNQAMPFGAGEGGARKVSGMVAGSQKVIFDSCAASIIPQGANPSQYPQWKFYTHWDNTGPNGDNTLADAEAVGLAAFKTWTQNAYMEPALTRTWVSNPWTEVAQQRHPLSTTHGVQPIQTNYGAGMQAQLCVSYTMPAAGSSPAFSATTAGLGRWAAATVVFTASGSSGPDLTPPTITLTQPPGGTDITLPAGTTSYTVQGSASDASGIQGVTINGSAVTVAAGGGFSKTLAVATGANPVTIQATDNSPAHNVGGANFTITVSSPTGGSVKVAYIADFGPTSITQNVVSHIPTDSTLAYVVDGGDNYNRGSNDATYPTDLTKIAGYFKNRGLVSRMLVTPGNHDWANRNIQPTAQNPAFQGLFYAWGNAAGLFAGNSGQLTWPYAKTVNGWTIIIANSVATSASTTTDRLVPDSECGLGATQLSQVSALLPTSGNRCVVFCHHPVWNADSQDHTDGTNGTALQIGNMRGAGSGPGNANLWSALQGKAIAIVTGHAHNMQVHHPRDATGKVSSNAGFSGPGVTQIVAGSGGGLNYPLLSTYTPAPIWVDGAGVPGFLLLDFSSQTQLAGSFIGQTGTTLQTFTIPVAT